MYVQQGVPSNWAAIELRIGSTWWYASGVPPGMMLGPLRAPSSPPDTPVPR